MGWSYAMSPSFGKADLIEKFLRPDYWREGVTVIDHRVTGRTFWAVLDDKGERSIWLALMDAGGADMGWGHKSLDEGSGPSRVDCPLVLLNQCSHPKNEYANAWREEVRAYHAKRAAVAKLGQEIKSGSRLVYGGKTFYAVQPASPGARKGWVVRDVLGALFRMPASQVRECMSALSEEPATPEAPKALPRTQQQAAMAFM